MTLLPEAFQITSPEKSRARAKLIVLVRRGFPFGRALKRPLERTSLLGSEPLVTVAVSASMRRRSSVLLIREYDQQLSGSGCCGRVEGDFARCDGEPVFAERRAIMERMGSVYRALKADFGETEVDVQIIDPRNAGLIFLLVRDFWAFGVGVRSALATLFRLSTHGVVVNGRLADRTAHPDPERIAEIVDEQLRGARFPTERRPTPTRTAASRAGPQR